MLKQTVWNINACTSQQDAGSIRFLFNNSFFELTLLKQFTRPLNFHIMYIF